MKQLFTGVLISALISVGLVGCTIADLDEPTEPTVPEVTVIEETTPEPEKTVFEDYGFALTFPLSWGEVETTIEDDIITLTGENDAQIVLVAISGDHSRYEAPLGVTTSHFVYVDNPDETPQAVLDTFEYVMEGKYFITDMLQMIMFDPDDPNDNHTSSIAFNNGEEVDKLFKRSNFPTPILENCLDFEGRATIVVKDYKLFETAPGANRSLPPYTGTLIEVLEQETPTCQTPLT